MKCKCDFRTHMLGDGCEVCNPAKSLEYARETIDEQAALIEEMGEALLGVRDYVVFMKGRGHPYQICIDAALAKWRESK